VGTNRRNVLAIIGVEKLGLFTGKLIAKVMSNHLSNPKGCQRTSNRGKVSLIWKSKCSFLSIQGTCRFLIAQSSDFSAIHLFTIQESLERQSLCRVWFCSPLLEDMANWQANEGRWLALGIKIVTCPEYSRRGRTLVTNSRIFLQAPNVHMKGV